MNEPGPVGQMIDDTATQRDIQVENLEDRLTELAAQLMEMEASQDASARQFLEALFTFDLALHKAALDSFERYSQPALDEFIERLKIEGWVGLGEYYVNNPPLQWGALSMPRWRLNFGVVYNAPSRDVPSAVVIGVQHTAA
jgi:hypothetical protein